METSTSFLPELKCSKAYSMSKIRSLFLISTLPDGRYLGFVGQLRQIHDRLTDRWQKKTVTNIVSDYTQAFSSAGRKKQPTGKLQFNDVNEEQQINTLPFRYLSTDAITSTCKGPSDSVFIDTRTGDAAKHIFAAYG
jgi:hypothetical protein